VPKTVDPKTVHRELAETSVALERAVSWIRRALRPAGWNTIALSTLDAVERSGPLRITDLTARERITQPGMTGVVARLESAGYVSRRADPTDGRATLVEATTEGRAFLRELRRHRAETLSEHLAALDPEHQRALVAAAAAMDALASAPLPDEDA
jgi:DNA-binding MarR family transcriptional regulator